MEITRQTAASQIAAYLHHEVTLAGLVDWAENALLDGQFADVEMGRSAQSCPAWGWPMCAPLD